MRKVFVDKHTLRLVQSGGLQNGDTLRTIYHSLILCHLTYGVLLWGAQLNENDKIYKLQKHTVRIITSSNYLSHSEPIFKQLYILKCIDIYKCQLLKCILKLLRRQLPYYLNVIPFAFNNQHHHHATRTSHNIIFLELIMHFLKGIYESVPHLPIIQTRTALLPNCIPTVLKDLAMYV